MNSAKQTAFKASGNVTSNCPMMSATMSDPATPPRLKPLIFTLPRAHPRNNDGEERDLRRGVQDVFQQFHELMD